MSEYFYDFLRTLVKEGKVKKDEPMSAHTTFKVGGPADYFIEPANEKELSEVIAYLNKASLWVTGATAETSSSFMTISMR